jgi:hypothetical protein
VAAIWRQLFEAGPGGLARSRGASRGKGQTGFAVIKPLLKGA